MRNKQQKRISSTNTIFRKTSLLIIYKYYKPGIHFYTKHKF